MASHWPKATSGSCCSEKPNCQQGLWEAGPNEEEHNPKEGQEEELYQAEVPS